MRINLDISGCVNGIPIAAHGKGHFGVRGTGQGSRLDIELAADVLPLQWDLALALPGFLDPLLFVLSRALSVVRGSEGAKRDDVEFLGEGVRAVTDWVLMTDVDQSLGRAKIVHSIDVDAGAVTLVSQFRAGRFELEVGERVSSINIERTKTPLPAGLDGAALLSAGGITTSRGRDCSFISTTRITCGLGFRETHDVSGPARVAIDRAGGSRGGGRVILSAVMGECVDVEDGDLGS